MIIKCPSCGAPLNPGNVIGRYVCCPACRNEFILHGETVSELSVVYHSPELSWESVIERCFSNVIENGDKKAASSIKILEHKELYIPFVEVINTDKNPSLVSVAAGDSPEIGSISDMNMFKRCRTADEPSSEISTVIPYEPSLLSESGNDYLYVGEVIRYVPVKYLSAEINGNVERFVSYGKYIGRIDGQEIKDSDSLQKKTIAVPAWCRIIQYTIAVSALIASWYYFCYTFYHFHGFFSLIIYACGLKCFLPFLGTCFVVLLGNTLLGDYISDLAESHQTKNKEKSIKETKQIILNKLSL